MNRVPLIALIAFLVLIGPATFVFSRSHALDVALARIRPGETPAQVVKALGPPQQRRIGPVAVTGSSPASRTPPKAPSAARVEYRYTVWPLPGAWRVDFEHDKVVGTARR